MLDSCICIYNDGPSCDFVSEKVQRACKEHQCCECGQPIKSGDEYEYARGAWEGNFDTFKTCMTCKRIRDSLFTCWVYGGLWEDVHEVICLGQDNGDGEPFCVCPRRGG